jgi:hypothetical protein
MGHRCRVCISFGEAVNEIVKLKELFLEREMTFPAQNCRLSGDTGRQVWKDGKKLIEDHQRWRIVKLNAISGSVLHGVDQP